MDEPPQFVKVKEEPIELEDEVPPQPIRFIRELFDVLQMDNMRDIISWNQNDDCRFTVHHRALFSEVIPTHFTGVGSLKRFEQLLRNYGFKKYGLEFRHKDRMLCKDKPLLLPVIKEEPPSHRPPVSFTPEEKAAASSHITREVGSSSDVWKGKESANIEALADANVVLKNQPPSVPYAFPTWSEAPCHEFRLDVFKDSVMIKQLPVYEKGAYIFGRMDVCDFVLGHLSISRFHAVLQFKRNGDAFIYDLGSTHGTFINDIQVNKKVYEDLSVGDSIRFGQSSRSYIFQKGTTEQPGNRQNTLDAEINTEEGPGH